MRSPALKTTALLALALVGPSASSPVNLTSLAAFPRSSLAKCANTGVYCST